MCLGARARCYEQALTCLAALIKINIIDHGSRHRQQYVNKNQDDKCTH